MTNLVSNKSPITEASVRATVSINGAKSTEWEMAGGGGKSAAIQLVRVGYQPDKTAAVPNITDSGDVQVTRHMVVADVWDLQAYLLTQVGVGTATVWLTPMDRLGADDYSHQTGAKSLAYKGIIQAVSPVQASNESTAIASVTMTIRGGTWAKAA